MHVRLGMCSQAFLSLGSSNRLGSFITIFNEQNGYNNNKNQKCKDNKMINMTLMSVTKSKKRQCSGIENSRKTQAALVFVQSLITKYIHSTD